MYIRIMTSMDNITTNNRLNVKKYTNYGDGTGDNLTNIYGPKYISSDDFYTYTAYEDNIPPFYVGKIDESLLYNNKKQICMKSLKALIDNKLSDIFLILRASGHINKIDDEIIDTIIESGDMDMIKCFYNDWYFPRHIFVDKYCSISGNLGLLKYIIEIYSYECSIANLLVSINENDNVEMFSYILNNMLETTNKMVTDSLVTEFPFIIKKICDYSAKSIYKYLCDKHIDIIYNGYPDKDLDGMLIDLYTKNIKADCICVDDPEKFVYETYGYTMTKPKKTKKAEEILSVNYKDKIDELNKIHNFKSR